MNRVLDQLAAAAKRQLLFDVGLVGFDRLHAEVQFLGDLARAASFADETEDFELAIRESRERECMSAEAPLMYWWSSLFAIRSLR